MKTLFFYLTLSFFCLNCFSQDIHSSQFYSIPSKINPAFTGFFTNDYYVAAVYKTQWSSVTNPYQTVGGTLEMSLLKNKRPNSIVGVGVEIINDRAGSINYTTNQFNLNVSYLQVLDVDRNHIIGFGFQNGLLMKRFDFSKATFGNQFDGFNTFNQSINPNETGLNTKQVDYNLSVGTVYSYAPRPHTNFYFGFSAFNITRPNVSFYNDKEVRLDTRFALMAGGEVKLKESWSLLPSGLFQLQGVYKEFMFGSFARYSMIRNKKERLGINFGAWYRLKDAVIPTIKVEYKNINLTASFDINVSKLTRVSNTIGSAEISISYSGLCFKEHVKVKKPVYCPAFVF